MKAIAHTLHGVVVAGVVGFGLWAVGRAVQLYGAEYIALTYGRTVPALLCGSYALGHLMLFIKRRMTTQAMLWFYPLSFLMGAIGTLVAQAHGKNWAPADAGEAFRASVVGFSILGALWLASAYSCYRAFTSPWRSGVQQTLQADAAAQRGLS